MGLSDELFVAVVALIVSVVALSATFMQVLQQYYASASGYSQCNEKVMGKWAKSKARRFSWEELRFEVHFDVPVIFVSPPNNESGPIHGADIFFLDGTQKSLDATMTTSEMDPRKEYERKSTKEKIHTADHERASWLILLYAVQRMEDKSREWQHDQYKDLGPQAHQRYGLPPAPPSLHESHTLTVALQRKRKSWDTMPAFITKPYATTTMCHLIEMMAALGVYWKEFDRKRDRYRAEGNGFMVLGERLSELGLMFSFQVYGKCYFERNRVIPVDEIKELCFGYVPTIYRETLDQRRLGFPSDESQNLSSLQMASRSEIAETLIVIGCNNNTVQYFLNEKRNTTHLFPLSFEILGMLSRTFHIKNSCFTYIPNPTADRWDKRSLSLVKIMESYKELSEVQLPGVARNGVIYGRIAQHMKEILGHHVDGDVTHRLLLLNSLHAALDDADEVLTAKSKESSQSDAARAGRPSMHQRNKAAEKGPRESPEAEKLGRRREMVQDVLRAHIQDVLRLLNDRDDRGSDSQSLLVPDMPPPSPGASRFPGICRSSPPRFEDINEASPEYRQHKYMEVYFHVIRQSVVPHAKISTNRRASVSKESIRRRASIAGAPPGFGLRKRGTGGTHASVAIQTDPGTVRPSTPLHVLGGEVDKLPASPLEHEVVPDDDVGGDENGEELPPQDTESVDGDRPPRRSSLADEPVSHDDIWCTLVFRMICWLMLHDFNKKDVQVSKSELLGSRMPVYIA
ncbi:Uncharacterized protein TPAR_06416 [Tolypocladium paradoxum]|uniref:Modin n=1 Tax=Tolypocladium paradoxum TaxID=94208 RepID=A0A2S4KT57_9HYPO|nr:Uncharacterized protein TPAR_06416 [Tolypocladium paradoxum]